jgi:hypothetical protein
MQNFTILKQNIFVWRTIYAAQLFCRIPNTSGQRAFQQTMVKEDDEAKLGLNPNQYGLFHAPCRMAP